MKYLLLCIVFLSIFFICSCTFYRHDMEVKDNAIVRDSKTYWSFAKDIAIDANDISVLSESKNGKLYTPWGAGEIGD